MRRHGWTRATSIRAATTACDPGSQGIAENPDWEPDVFGCFDALRRAPRRRAARHLPQLRHHVPMAGRRRRAPARPREGRQERGDHGERADGGGAHAPVVPVPEPAGGRLAAHRRPRQPPLRPAAARRTLPASVARHRVRDAGRRRAGRTGADHAGSRTGAERRHAPHPRRQPPPGDRQPAAAAGPRCGDGMRPARSTTVGTRSGATR